MDHVRAYDHSVVPQIVRQCSVVGCGRMGKLTRGLCRKHYQRWLKTADPSELHRPPESLQEAFDRHPKTRVTSGCLEWGGPATHDGYGVLCYGGKNYYAHRVAYELEHGPIPLGLEGDHRCLNTRCVEASHIRAITHKQNTEHRRGAYSNSLTGVRGVTYDAGRRKYQARVKHNYREIHVGRFDTLAEAEAAVVMKRRELFTHNDKDWDTA